MREEPIEDRAGLVGPEAVEAEFAAIREMLAACGGNRVETAKRLGISERTLRYRLAKAREQGEEITTNVRTIATVPLRLQLEQPPAWVEVRGEALIPDGTFAAINAQPAATTLAIPEDYVSRMMDGIGLSGREVGLTAMVARLKRHARELQEHHRA